MSEKEERDISNENQITQYIHCGLCIEEYMKSEERISPKDYAKTQTGFTAQGIQVWCNRHECNILHVDFEGHQHPANTTRKEK